MFKAGGAKVPYEGIRINRVDSFSSIDLRKLTRMRAHLPLIAACSYDAGTMSRIFRLSAIILLLVLIAIAWVWWNRPAKTDLASCVPADSLVYLESNSLLDVAGTITNTDAWRNLAPYYELKSDRWQNRWLTSIARTTGIGSAQTVIAARAQVAFVMLDLNQSTNGETLEFKSHDALIVETHTSQMRMKPVIERLLGDLARQTYGRPTFERIEKDNGEFLRWTNADGRRKLVVSFDGTVAIVGNDEQAVSACLAARRGQRPSLSHQPEMEDMRSRMKADEALAFGYVPSAKAPELFSQSIPLLLGRLPNEIQKLLAAVSGKLVGTVGWSAHPFSDGIEDRYFMSLKPTVVAQLTPTFTSSGQQRPKAWGLLPSDTYSVTNYNFDDPARAWDALRTTLSSQVDVLTAVVVNEFSKVALVPYGVDEPEVFLRAIKPELVTARLDSTSERAVVIARVANETTLKQFVERRFRSRSGNQKLDKDNLVVSADGQLSATFVEGYFLLGSPEDLRHCLAARARQATLDSSPENLSRVSHYAGSDEKYPPAVVTYSHDNERVRAFVSTIRAFRDSRSSVVVPTDAARSLSGLPYSEVETRLVGDGFERRTRSPLGLFSTLVSFLSDR